MDPLYDINEDEKKDLFSTGQKLISEGKVGLILNISGLSDPRKNSNIPKVISRPDWPITMNLLTFIIKRVKKVGDQATKDFGKNELTSNREPILILLIVNELEMEAIDDFL